MKQVFDTESGTPEWINEVDMQTASTYSPVSLDWLITHPKFWIVQQFTDLIDWKGKEVYEGDILAIKGEKLTHILEVLWSEKFHAFLQKDASGQTIPLTLGETTSNLQVIGNIFENPLLLK